MRGAYRAPRALSCRATLRLHVVLPGFIFCLWRARGKKNKKSVARFLLVFVLVLELGLDVDGPTYESCSSAVTAVVVLWRQ